jgi:hypothetical protein
MIVTADMKLNEVEFQFHKLFPYLRLEFPLRNQKRGVRSLIQTGTDLTDTIASFSRGGIDGNLRILPSMSVSRLKQSFLTHYGIEVLVFRHSGHVWLETTITDHWTLEEQNKEGKALSKVIV